MSSIYSKDELIKAIRQGEQFTYTFFWGHRVTANGGVGASCMSQWFEADFEIEGDKYSSAEHYMMAEKARLFGDEEIRKKILQSKTPNEAKGLGRKIKSFDESKWCENRFDIVVRGNEAKFSQNPRLAHFLKSSSPNVLVEASPVDAIWGIGLHRDDPAAQNPEEWNGLNLLGFALMKVRDELLIK